MNVIYYRHNKYDEKPHDIELGEISFNELTFVIKDQLTYSVNGEEFTVKENDCIFLKSGSKRKREKSEFCDYVSFNFNGDLDTDFPVYLHDCLSTEIKLLISVCDEIFSKCHDWSDKINTALNLIFKLLKDRLSAQKENPVIVKIKRYIKQNLSEKLTLDLIAAQVGYSPNYCDTIFKKETDDSILNYTISERIIKAKLLLQEDVLSLKEIAEAVGFEDYNYFSRAFKKKSGYPPSEYKRSVLNSR